MKRVLTAEQKKEILAKYFGEDEKATQMSQGALAKEYSVSQSTISNAIKYTCLETMGTIKKLQNQNIPQPDICKELGVSQHLYASIYVHACTYMPV